jgi:hypothetical protein
MGKEQSISDLAKTSASMEKEIAEKTSLLVHLKEKLESNQRQIEDQNC